MRTSVEIVTGFGAGLWSLYFAKLSPSVACRRCLPGGEGATVETWKLESAVICEQV